MPQAEVFAHANIDPIGERALKIAERRGHVRCPRSYID